MVYKTILGIVPGLQATALVSENIPKNLCPKPGMKMRSKGMGRGMAIGRGRGPIGRMKQSRIPKQNMVRQGVRNLVGIGLIGATAAVINKL